MVFFRRRTPPFEPAVHWVFAEDIDATYKELESSGANIVEPLEVKPWDQAVHCRRPGRKSVLVSQWVKAIAAEVASRS